MVNKTIVEDIRYLYSSIYSQEESQYLSEDYEGETTLTEEQVWEEVEVWVNQLLDEGYDLSDYSWEEMYEAYVTEFWGALGSAALKGLKFAGTAAKAAAKSPAAARVASAAGRGVNAAARGVGRGAQPVLSRAATEAGKYGTMGALGLTADELLTRGAGRELIAKGLEQSRKLGPALRGETDSTTAKPSSEEDKSKESESSDSEKSEKSGKATGKIVAAAGGKGGTVTSGTKYAATLGGRKGHVIYDDEGKKTFTTDSYEYDAYNVVLDYLFENGHVDTLEEAHYVMLEMEPEVIQDIVAEYTSY